MTATEMTAHDEHERAKRKHLSWLEEIESWKAEHKRALETLELARMFVQEHDALLDHHQAAISEHEKGLEAHEAAISRASSGADDPATAAEHKRLEVLHGSVLERHNSFRGRHPALIRKITELAVELHKVSHLPG